MGETGSIGETSHEIDSQWITLNWRIDLRLDGTHSSQLFSEHQSREWTCSRNIVMCSPNPAKVSAEHTFSLHRQATLQLRGAMELSFSQWNVGKSYKWYFQTHVRFFVFSSLSIMTLEATCWKWQPHKIEEFSPGKTMVSFLHNILTGLGHKWTKINFYCVKFPRLENCLLQQIA